MKSSRAFSALLITALALAPLAALAQPYNYPPPPSGYQQGGARDVIVWISSVQGSSFTTGDGRTVFLHRGTIINPTGITLRPGMRVHVWGWTAHNHNINADKVSVLPRR